MSFIAIIDYGVGNLGSILKAVENCGAKAKLTREAEEILNADKIILPGVGSFLQGMNNLIDFGLIEPIKNAVSQETPLLGICLGMQLLADFGSEGGQIKGLGLISGEVKKLVPVHKTERIPHVGWNEIEIVKSDPILKGIENGTDFYFVHSYYFHPSLDTSTIAFTSYCRQFPSIINRNHIYGVQFHPEKSTPGGIRLLRNFIEI